MPLDIPVVCVHPPLLFALRVVCIYMGEGRGKGEREREVPE